MTCWGFCEVAALSRYTIGLSPTVRDRMGKSSRTRSTSSGRTSPSITLAISDTTFSRRRNRFLLLDAELLAEVLVPLPLELVGELLAAGLHDPPVHHHVHVIRRDVVEDALVVRDQQDPQRRSHELGHPRRHLLQRVDVQTR